MLEDLLVNGNASRSSGVDKAVVVDRVPFIVNLGLNHYTSSASMTCSNGGVPVSNPEPDDDDLPLDTASAALFAVVGFLVVILIGHMFWSRYLRSKHITGDNVDKCSDSQGETKAGSIKMSEWRQWQWHLSIFNMRHDITAEYLLLPLVRVGTPVMLIIAFSLLVSSNVYDSVSVTLIIHREPGDLTWDLYRAGNLRVLMDMWDQKTYALATLLALTSGVGAFLAIGMLLYSWFAPPEVISLKNREKWIRWVHFLGKWTLMNTFSFFIVMVSFSLQTDFVSGGDGKVTVKPEKGFFLFLVGIFLALLTSDFALFAINTFEQETATKKIYSDLYGGSDRWSKLPGAATYLENVKVKDWSSPYTFVAFLFGNPTAQGELLLSKHGYMGTMAILVLFLCVTILSYSTEIMAFKFEGLTGHLLAENPAGGDGAYIRYSILSIWDHVPEATGEGGTFGIIFLRGCLMLTCVIAPTAHALASICLHWVPVSAAMQRQFFVAVEYTQKWSMIEVFAIIALVTLQEIDKLAFFIIGDNCDVLNDAIVNWADDQLDGNNQCFDVDPNVQSWGIAVLFYMLLLTFVLIPLFMFYRKAIEIRVAPAGVNLRTALLRE